MPRLSSRRSVRVSRQTDGFEGWQLPAFVSIPDGLQEEAGARGRDLWWLESARQPRGDVFNPGLTAPDSHETAYHPTHLIPEEVTGDYADEHHVLIAYKVASLDLNDSAVELGGPPRQGSKVVSTDEAPSGFDHRGRLQGFGNPPRATFPECRPSSCNLIAVRAGRGIVTSVEAAGRLPSVEDDEILRQGSIEVPEKRDKFDPGSTPQRRHLAQCVNPRIGPSCPLEVDLPFSEELPAGFEKHTLHGSCVGLDLPAGEFGTVVLDEQSIGRH
jgi:hypothetical protein